MIRPIPDEALDDRLGFVGTAGSGKSYNAMGRVERLLQRKARVCCIDPLGVFWGLRLMPDGETPSPFNIPIFGGEHGDLPLNEHAGALIGETVASMAESCVVDLSGIGTKNGERRFMLAFLTALYRKTKGEPLHLIIDEADMFAPQKLNDKEGDAAKLLGMMETVVRRGRIKGFIPWLITQRPAVIAKDVLSQVDGLVAFKLTSSQDRDALAAWVEGSADKDDWKTTRAALPAMERGTGLVWIPGRGILDTVKFPEKITYDSSRTPARGEKKKRAAELKPLNLDALKGKLAAVEKERADNDPKALKAEVARLTRELDQVKRDTPAGAEEITRAEQRGRDDGFSEGVQVGHQEALQIVADIRVAIYPILDNAGARADDMGKRSKINVAPSKSAQGHPLMAPAAVARRREQSQKIAANVVNNTPMLTAKEIVNRAAGTEYSNPQRRVLRALATWHALGQPSPSRQMVAVVAGYSPKSSGYDNLIGALAGTGAIGKPMPGHLSLLDNSIEGMSREDAGQNLFSVLSAPQRKIVDGLNGSGVMTRQDLAERAGYSPLSSGYDNLIGSLSSLGILVKPQPGAVALSDWAQELLQ